MSEDTGGIRRERHHDVLVLVLDHPPVNASNAALRAGLLAGVAELESDPALVAAVIVGDHGTFVSGSDLSEFEGPVPLPQLPTVIEALVESPKPVVAALDGYALGGGLELALGCDVRLATPAAQLGLPEVTLGMVPGAGGTQRLPLLVGRVAAADLVLTGRRIDGAEAARLGLVDEVVPRGELLDGALRAARRAASSSPVRRAPPRESEDEVEIALARGVAAAAGRPHALAAAALLRGAGGGDLAAALAEEREVFDRFRNGPEAAAMRHLFFAERRAATAPELRGVSATRIQQVGVTGGGTDRLLQLLARTTALPVEPVAADVVLCSSLDGAAAGDLAIGLPPGDVTSLALVEVLRPPGSDPGRVKGVVRLLQDAGLTVVLPHVGQGPIGPRVAAAADPAATAVALVEAGVARSVDDVDVVMVGGYGSPRHLGGPVYAARAGH